jgi:hypothetical protein
MMSRESVRGRARERQGGARENSEICENCERVSKWEGCAFGCGMMRKWERE